jgi:hypothetical protein
MVGTAMLEMVATKMQSQRHKQPHLTNRWSQPLAVVMPTFDLMKPFSMFDTHAHASGG